MREIKFRAWDTDKKEMAHVSHMNFDDYEVCLQNEGGTWHSAGHYTAYIMQCVGLKDKNGVDIYEDDIVEVTAHCLGDIDFKGVVKFYEGCFVIDNGKDAIPLFSETSTLVVVDNIYEKLKREIA